MSYTFILCRSTGEPLGAVTTAKARKVTRTLNSPTTATLTFLLTDQLALQVIPGQSRLKVYRDPSQDELNANPAAVRSLVFYGSLPTQNITMSADAEEITCVFADPRWVLGYRFAAPNGPEVYTATDQGLISWGLVNTQNGRSGGDTWLRQGATATGIVRDRTYDRQLVAQLHSDLAGLLDGPDIDCGPRDGYASLSDRSMGLLNTYARQGSDRPNAVFAYGPDLPSNVDSAGLTYLPVTTLSTVVGTDANGVPVIGTYGTPDANGLGLLEDYSADPDVSTQATVDAKARGVVLDQQGLRPVVTVGSPLPGIPRAFEHYDLGDTIRVNVRKGAFVVNSAPRVHAFDLTIDQEGREMPTLTFA